MKQVVILFGPPGAGKGTQSELLAERMGLFLFETSKMLERNFKEVEKSGNDESQRYVEIEGEKFDVLHEKELWQKGILCSPPWVTYLIIKEIKKLCENGESLVLAGSPRTIYEVQRELPVMIDLYGKENIKVVLIEVGPEKTIFRNTHRKICDLMRHSILFNDETEKLTKCPLDGSALTKRKDLDDEETIKVRIKEYNERTLPMVEEFQKEGINVKKVNGEQFPADVFKDILDSIK